MDILLDQITLPEHGEVELKFERKFVLNISAEQARRQVNRWLLLEVSSMIGAEAPTLVIGHRVVWRVPAIFTAPHIGPVGVAGWVEVDVQTGEINNTPECKTQIEDRVRALAAQLPPYPTQREVPAQFWAKDKVPTHKAAKVAATLAHAA